MKLSNFIKTLGPGILFASTAIGVSHLVQSTRAGAVYGFEFVWAIAIANLLKYPFFEFASRYASATGTSIIEGYQRIGKWMLWLYFLITLTSMFFVTAAVVFVTSGFLENIINLSILSDYPLASTSLLFLICLAILISGKFNLLDSLTKIIGIILLISTLIAFVLTLVKGSVIPAENFNAPDAYNVVGISFLIALMGWMPTAVDLSAWTSLWTVERIKQTGYKPSLKETLADFNLGYILSALLAFCFLTLGAYLVYGSEKSIPEGSVPFSKMVIELYTSSIGEWSFFLIAAAACSIMFGTAITVLDGYSRSIEKCTKLLFLEKNNSTNTIYTISLLLLSIGAFAIIYYFHDKPKGFKGLIDLATSISFLIAPIIAVANHKLVSKKFVGTAFVPKMWLHLLSILGIVFLLGFSLFYTYNCWK